jgi:hypothetical protein
MKPKRKLHWTTTRASVCSMSVAVVSSLPLVLWGSPASAETRGYVISWFATATNNPDFVSNCPQAASDPDRVKFVAKGRAVGGEEQQRRDRALVDGKPVPALAYPDAVVQDPSSEYEPVAGEYAYGFDLGGAAANKFIDPDTHEKVDNQLWRALGCNFIFQATPPRAPYFQEEAWMNFIDSSPGWAIRITGADLAKDGPVIVTLDRTTRHLERNALGGVRSDVTYVIDPSPRSHNVLPGEIKNGILTIKPAYVYLEGDMTWYAAIDLKDAHMRIHSEPGKLVGYWGGYTDWHRWVYQCTSRPGSNCDGVGFYRALEKFADADPDPGTGKNRLISTTWRMEAVPAYLAGEDGTVLATASGAGLGGAVHEPTVAVDPTAH